MGIGLEVISDSARIVIDQETCIKRALATTCNFDLSNIGLGQTILEIISVGIRSSLMTCYSANTSAPLITHPFYVQTKIKKHESSTHCFLSFC